LSDVLTTVGFTKENIMKKALIIGATLLAGVGSTAVYAQHRMHRDPPRISAEDRSAFVDARIAAVHAGLKLNAEQEKNWPAVETAVRDFAKLRMDRANARATDRDARGSGNDATQAPDPVARLRERADDMATTAAALKKIVDAADPLYKSLDDGQKRRLMRLAGPGSGARGMDRMDRRMDEMRRNRRMNFDGPQRGRDDGPRDFGPRRDNPAQNGPDRL
jgi:LTXXQ motif family protein